MSCDFDPLLLSAYLDGEIRAEKQGLVEDHLRHCPLCRTEYRTLKGIHEAIEHVADPSIPPALVANIAAHTVAEKGGSHRLLSKRWLSIFY